MVLTGSISASLKECEITAEKNGVRAVDHATARLHGCVVTTRKRAGILIQGNATLQCDRCRKSQGVCEVD